MKGGVPTLESCMDRFFMTELGQRVADAALEILGAGGPLQSGVAGAAENS